VPIIAAVHGHALGFGATIVTSCDVIVAWKDAKLGDPHVKAGLVAGDGGVLSWSAAAGVTRAKRMLLTGDSITAQDAYCFGLVTDLVDTPEEAYPTALAKHRNSVALDLSVMAENISIASEDLREALAALTEKRAGDFKNR
jgi:enoyl-CoA hydratase